MQKATSYAELLVGKGANHIVFHLLVLAIEEIGKIYIGFTELTKQEQWDKQHPNFGFDDHIKKLFWAV